MAAVRAADDPEGTSDGEEAHGAVYQISGLDPSSTLSEVRQAFRQHGLCRLLEFDGAPPQPDDRKHKVGLGQHDQHRVLLAPHGCVGTRAMSRSFLALFLLSAPAHAHAHAHISCHRCHP